MIVVHSMRADGHQQPQHFYFACTDPECGWVAPLRRDRLTAVLDGHRHQQVKATTKDEAR